MVIAAHTVCIAVHCFIGVVIGHAHTNTREYVGDKTCTRHLCNRLAWTLHAIHQRHRCSLQKHPCWHVFWSTVLLLLLPSQLQMLYVFPFGTPAAVSSCFDWVYRGLRRSDACMAAYGVFVLACGAADAESAAMRR